MGEYTSKVREEIEVCNHGKTCGFAILGLRVGFYRCDEKFVTKVIQSFKFLKKNEQYSASVHHFTCVLQGTGHSEPINTQRWNIFIQLYLLLIRHFSSFIFVEVLHIWS